MQNKSYYDVYKAIQRLEIEELERCLQHHGGTFSWVDEDDEYIEDLTIPSVTICSKYFTGMVDIKKAWINDDGRICLHASDSESGFSLNVDVAEIMFGDIEFICGLIPEKTSGVESHHK